MGFSAGRTAGIICAALGVLMVLVGAGVLIGFKPVITHVFGKKVALSPTSNGFPIWRDVSEHLNTRVAWYFFNLTNPEQFKEGAKPILKEIGPFWYKAKLAKKNIIFNDNSTVSFEEHRSFEFDPINSVLPETTNITMVNVPLMAVLNRAYHMSYWQRSLVGAALDSIEQASDVIVNYTISELTYKGQPNTLVGLGKIKEGLLDALASINSGDARFGFAVDKNQTNPGIFNMYTGATGVMDLNRIYSMNYEHELDLWTNEQNNTCNKVDGTFGYLRPPMNESNEQIVYVPDMCRPVTLRYVEDTQSHGLRLRRFSLGIENFAKSSEVSKNFCYDNLYHLPSGVTEVGPCKKGAPILMSMPHFLDADKSFREAVIGMIPDMDKHRFIMDHEPTTGMTVAVRGRLQANIRVVPVDLSGGDYLPEVILPLFWQEMYVEAGEGVFDFLRKVTGYPGLAKIALIIVILIGLILAIIGAGLLVNNARRTQRSEELAKDRKVNYTKAAMTDCRVDVA